MICKVQTDPNIGRIGLIKVGNHGILFNRVLAYFTILGELLENRLVKCKEMNIGANEIIDTGVNTGLIRFKINATSASCVFFCNSGSSNIMLITQNIDNYFTTNKSSNSGKIALYKESDNGNILIKNLTAINYGTFVFYYI